MDIHSLVAALPALRRPIRSDARAEERYWREQATFPHLRPRPLVSVATATGLVLLLIGVAQA
jgi:hypothetical protein